MAIQLTKVVVQILISLNLCQALEIKQVHFEKSAKICAKTATEPFFDVDLIIGRPWRIYYTWNVDMEVKCLDMMIKNATVSIVNRIYNDMHDYLKTQPEWAAASIFVSLGTAKHELLLFADQGAEGNFLAVPNVIKNGVITPNRNTVPLLKFFIKLVHDGKYLLMMDCQIGVASLMSVERPPYRAEIDSVAKSLNLGTGMDACVTEKRTDEELGQLEEPHK